MAKAAKAAKKTAARSGTTTRSLRQSGAVSGPLYEVIKAPTHLNQVLHPIGAKVVYFGEPGSTLLALNDEAKARKIAIRDIRQDEDLSDEDKKEARRALSDEWNGVESPDDFSDSEANLDASEANLDEKSE